MSSSSISMNFLKSIVVALACLSTMTKGQGVIQQTDPCVDQARQSSSVQLLRTFPQLEYIVQSLPTSRDLYRNLFSTQVFASNTFREFCNAYTLARAEFDRCPESQYKRMILSGYRLADHVCIARVYEYATNMPCLEATSAVATEQCRPLCGQDEMLSRLFLEPPMQSPTLQMDFINYMAGDCRYLSCLSSCKLPLYQQRCSYEAAQLEQEALSVTYMSIRDLYEPQTSYYGYDLQLQQQQQQQTQFRNGFPFECRQLADQAYYWGAGATVSCSTLILLFSLLVLRLLA